MREKEEPSLGVISSIYEAALEPTRWGEVLAGIQEHLQADSSVLWVEDLRGMDVPFEVARDLDATVMDRYYQHYINVDPFFAHRVAQPAGTLTPSHRIVPDAELERSEYYQDFLRDLGRFYTLGGLVTNHPDSVAVFSVQREKGRGPFTGHDLRRLQTLFPHLRRAFQIGSRLAGRETERQAMLALLERLPTGVLLLDEGGRVVFLNRRAQAMLAAGDGLVMTAQGLSTTNPELQPSLERLIHEAVRTGAGQGAHAGGALLVPAGPQAEPYQVLVAPLRTERLRVDVGRGRICAALFVQLHESAPALDADVLRDLFGLTPAEARVTTALVQGQRPEEIAAAARASRFTIRAQLSAIYEKLGVHRQAELVQRVLSSPAVLNEPPADGRESGDGA